MENGVSYESSAPTVSGAKSASLNAQTMLETLKAQASAATENANRLASLAEEQRRIARAAVAGLHELQNAEPLPMFDPSGEESEGMDSPYAQKRGAF